MRFLTALLCIAACASAQQPRMLDSTFVAAQWQYVTLCSGLTPQPGGRLEDVHWRIVAPHPRIDSYAPPIASGAWIAPDTILLDSISVFNVWVMRHELMHQLLRGPPLDQGGPHPWYPFAIPCQLMPGQHFAGPE